MKQQAICELCMQAFEKRSANQKYCTKCGVEMRKQQHREIIKNSKLRKTAARNYNKPENPIHLKKNARKSICIINCTTRITATENIRHSKGLEEFKRRIL